MVNKEVYISAAFDGEWRCIHKWQTNYRDGLTRYPTPRRHIKARARRITAFGRQRAPGYACGWLGRIMLSRRRPRRDWSINDDKDDGERSYVRPSYDRRTGTTTIRSTSTIDDDVNGIDIELTQAITTSQPCPSHSNATDNKKLSCRRETAPRFVSLKIIQTGTIRKLGRRSYSSSIVTMAPSCIISDIKRDIDRKLWFFSYPPLHSTPPLGGLRRSIAIPFSVEKLE